LLQHQTEAQYSTAEWIKTRVAVRNVWLQSHIWNPLIVSKVQHELSAFYLQGCHILEKSWIFLLSWKVLENIWVVSRVSPGQYNKTTFF